MKWSGLFRLCIPWFLLVLQTSLSTGEQRKPSLCEKNGSDPARLEIDPKTWPNKMSLGVGVKKPWYILFNINGGNRKEREKKDRKKWKKKCSWWLGGEGESNRGKVGAYHSSEVPMMSCCSPPSCVGGENPPLPLPHQRVEFHALIYNWARWEHPCVSLAKASLTLSLGTLKGSVASFLVLWCRIWGPLWGCPLMGWCHPLCCG